MFYRDAVISINSSINFPIGGFIGHLLGYYGFSRGEGCAVGSAMNTEVDWIGRRIFK